MMIDSKKVKQIVKSMKIEEPVLKPDDIVELASWNSGFNTALKLVLNEIKKMEKR